jgi:hypothetical protein
MCVRWKNGDTSWESLKDMKEANPMESAEYAVAHGISTKPAFNGGLSIPSKSAMPSSQQYGRELYAKTTSSVSRSRQTSQKHGHLTRKMGTSFGSVQWKNK